MEILVCIKQVPDDSVEIHLNPSTMTPDLSQADPQGNAFDTYALELAVRYIEANGGSVTVASLGPEDNKTCLKNALAVGATKAYHISDEGAGELDAAGTAALLAQAIPKIEEQNGAKFDLVLCGRESTDYIGGEVGELLAEKLGRAFASDIVEVTAEGDGIKVKKELDSGYLLLSASLPAVLTITKPDYDPRYPTIKSKLAARKVKIPTLKKDEIGADAASIQPKITYLAFVEPPKREAGIKIEEDEPEVAMQRAFEIMLKDKVL